MKAPICSKCNKPMKFARRGPRFVVVDEKRRREIWDTYKCECGRQADRRVK